MLLRKKKLILWLFIILSCLTIIYIKLIRPLKGIDLKEFANIENQRTTIDSAINKTIKENANYLQKITNLKDELTKTLKEMQETQLNELSYIQSYRLTVDRGWETTISFMAWKQEAKAYINFKNKKNDTLLSLTKELEDTNWQQIINSFEQMSFWNLPQKEKVEYSVFDADNFIIEGRKGNLYHFIGREEQVDTSIYTITLLLFDLSKPNIDTFYFENLRKVITRNDKN